MPSWNIHTAHVERLLREEGAARLGIADPNVFLFGNLLPDVYVGYMVEHPTRTIDYRVTHYANSEKLPVPRHREFWEKCVEGRGRVSDLVLGTWCHLVCDNAYNTLTRAYVASIGIAPSDETRERKQADFATFGRTLDISMVPEVTPALLAACAAFPQYPVDEPDVRAAVEVAAGIVAANHGGLASAAPAYGLLTPAFFEDAREKANAGCREGLLRYAASL